MTRLKRFILRLRYWNLMGRRFVTYFHYEDGRMQRREYVVWQRSQYGKDQWRIADDEGYRGLTTYNGYYIREALIKPHIIES